MATYFTNISAAKLWYLDLSSADKDSKDSSRIKAEEHVANARFAQLDRAKDKGRNYFKTIK